MLARQAVLLTSPKFSHPIQLLSRQHFICVSPLAAILMELPASIANKRLAPVLSPLNSALTKNRGEGCPPLEVLKFRLLDGYTFRRALLSLFAPRVFHNSLALKRFHTLSQKCRCVTVQFPFWELLAGRNAEDFLFSSSPFNGLHTLPSSVSPNSFACHSYENCRV